MDGDKGPNLKKPPIVYIVLFKEGKPQFYISVHYHVISQL